MKRLKQVLSLGLAAVMAVTAVAPAYGEVGEPLYDETLYVTLDPYGEVTESSVVKGYSLNGASQIVDHGTYESVVNMTDYGDPQIGEDGTVVFQVENPDKRFYFEGKTASLPTELPWDIRVSYQLNGVDRKAEDLAGASGLVQMNVDLMPNQKADSYFRNNMMLEMASIFNVDDILSLEAPGAQVQALGNQKAVIFLALPGEEEHFSIRVGTDSFEFTGLIFMMQPVTVGQLDKLTDLKEAKETIEDSVDAINDSLDVLLDTLDDLNGGLGDTVNGLKELDHTRRIINSSKGKVYENADEALKALTALADDMEPFTGHIKTGQNALDDLNRNLNELVYTLDDLSPELEDMRYDIRTIVDEVEKLQAMAEKGEALTARQLRQIIEKLKARLEAVKANQGQLSGSLEYLMQLLPSLAAGLSGLDGYSMQTQLGYTAEDLESMVWELADMGLADVSELRQVLREEYGLSSDLIQKILPVLKKLIGGGAAIASMTDAQKEAMIQKIVRQLVELLGKMDGGVQDSIGFVTALEQLIEKMEQEAAALEQQVGAPVKSIQYRGRDLALSAASVLRVGDDLISAVDSLDTTMNDYHHDARQALEDADQLILTAMGGVNTLQAFFSTFKEEVQIAGDSLNQGTQMTLSGLINSLETAMEGIARTSTIREAKNTIKTLVDDKWEEYTGEDNNLLNIDTEAPFVSLTSDENRPPESIQVVLRTKEITVDDKETAAEVDEDYHPEGNFLHRIGNILKRIWSSITSIFR